MNEEMNTYRKENCTSDCAKSDSCCGCCEIEEPTREPIEIERREAASPAYGFMLWG